jgi:hypothetical protein
VKHAHRGQASPAYDYLFKILVMGGTPPCAPRRELAVQSSASSTVELSMMHDVMNTRRRQRGEVVPNSSLHRRQLCHRK